MTVTIDPPAPVPEKRSARPRPRRARRNSSLAAHGEPLVWLSGGALAICLTMIVGLLALVIYQGGRTFWPQPITELETADGVVLLGQVTKQETYVPEEQLLESLSDEDAARVRAAAEANDGTGRRRLLRTENYELTETHFDWVDEAFVVREEQPEWALCLERTAKGRFYGTPERLLVEGETIAEGSEDTWAAFGENHPAIARRLTEIRKLERHELGEVNAEIEAARLALRAVELDEGVDSRAWREQKAEHDRRVAGAQTEFTRITDEIARLRQINANYEMRLRVSDGTLATLSLADIVRAIPANQLDLGQKLAVYGARWAEFLTAEPREANSEGGVWPALFGTVVMTLIMSILVVPIGVLAALYLHEYAKQGTLVSLVRIAVNNLAGVPSIVFGVFGLGFFCYIFGVGIDELFFSERLPNPTYGKGGILWASLTLALLTLPVVIVATEEALSAVPNSMREGSYACGATKWQTIRRIVLPRAQPGIMTGTILAIARGAGEVAPLMLVGAVKLAPDLPVDLARFPYVFPERSFMHLGFHIYDVGFQSQNSEAAKPMVYTTTLLLIGIVVLLNVFAITMRSRLRRKFQAAR